jgi:hypothetical protein
MFLSDWPNFDQMTVFDTIATGIDSSIGAELKPKDQFKEARQNQIALTKNLIFRSLGAEIIQQ